jgi:hypothetical protein
MPTIAQEYNNNPPKSHNEVSPLVVLSQLAQGKAIESAHGNIKWQGQYNINLKDMQYSRLIPTAKQQAVVVEIFRMMLMQDVIQFENSVLHLISSKHGLGRII